MDGGSPGARRVGRCRPGPTLPVWPGVDPRRGRDTGEPKISSETAQPAAGPRH